MCVCTAEPCDWWQDVNKSTVNKHVRSALRAVHTMQTALPQVWPMLHGSCASLLLSTVDNGPVLNAIPNVRSPCTLTKCCMQQLQQQTSALPDKEYRSLLDQAASAAAAQVAQDVVLKIFKVHKAAEAAAAAAPPPPGSLQAKNKSQLASDIMAAVAASR